jgi:hypothetical protein
MSISGIRKPSSLLVTKIVIAGAAAVLLLWGLGYPYLWQDEAATAVLAERMLRFGKPLAYDGLNLITIDHSVAENSNNIDRRTRDPQSAINFYIERGDFKRDTAWKWQPWGQFVAAALSFKIFGATTFAARLPFAIAGVITVLLLYQFVWSYFKNSQMALLASAFLLLNTYWILHSRQCRYYSLSSLFLMLTMVSYARWQRGGRGGTAMFVGAAWCWFQVDYGSLWPVLGVLFADALIARRHNWWRPLLVAAVLAAAIAPFAYYYELWGRLSLRDGTWYQRFMLNLFNMNEYVVPTLIVGAAVAVLITRSKILPAPERRLIVVVCAIFAVLLFWVPTVAPAPFLRYVIATTPVACLLAAWVLVRLGSSHRAITWAGAAVFVFTPWLSLPLHAVPFKQRDIAIIRPELPILFKNVFGHPADPNRLVVEWLRQNAAPNDEILINYEDIPFMFYLPNPIRGGMAAFRVEDDARQPADFLVLRRSADFGHWDVYQREMRLYRWDPVPLQAPDIKCGNCPDPIAQEFQAEGYDPAHARLILIARRVTQPGAQ